MKSSSPPWLSAAAASVPASSWSRMSFGIEGSFRRDILGLLLAHYDSPHTKFLTVPEPLLPKKPRGVPRVDDRRVLTGIFWVLRSGAPWRELLERYGSRKRPRLQSSH